MVENLAAIIHHNNTEQAEDAIEQAANADPAEPLGKFRRRPA
jgi:hypothetical protein